MLLKNVFSTVLLDRACDLFGYHRPFSLLLFLVLKMFSLIRNLFIIALFSILLIPPSELPKIYHQ